MSREAANLQNEQSAGHTPAPWRVSDEGHGVRDVGHNVIAHIRRRPESAVMLANARLIASAPELLAALREMNRSGVLDSGMSVTLARQARAAIAKAEGR